MNYIRCFLAYVMVIVAIVRKEKIADAVEKALNETGALIATKHDKVQSKIGTLQSAQMEAAVTANNKIETALAMAETAKAVADLNAEAARKAAIEEMARKQEKHSVKIGKLTEVAGTLAGLANPGLGMVITAIGSGISSAEN